MRFTDLYALTRNAGKARLEDRVQPRRGPCLLHAVLDGAYAADRHFRGGLLFSADAACNDLVDQLRTVIGDAGAAAVQQMLRSAKWPNHGGMAASLLGLVLMRVGATSVFAELQNPLDMIWRSPAPKPLQRAAWWMFVRTRLLSFGLILGVGFLLIVSLVFSAGFSAIERNWAPRFGAWQAWATLANVTVSFASMTVLFAMIYKLMPTAKVDWSNVWLGALVTAMLFSVGPSLTGLYIGHSSVTTQFGAAGSLVVLLIWIYFSAQIFLLGAEFTCVYAGTLGSRQPNAEMEL